MITSLRQEIVDQLTRYLSGERSFDAFQDWLITALWRVDESGDVDAAPLANRIEHRVAEYTSGYCTEPELKQALGPLLVPDEVGSRR
jgi:hypothetical protein